MEEENMKNTMDSIADEEEEEEEFSEDEEKLSSSTSSGSEDWPSTNVEQHGMKLSRAASKVTFKLKLILVYHKNVTMKQTRKSSCLSVHSQYRVKLPSKRRNSSKVFIYLFIYLCY